MPVDYASGATPILDSFPPGVDETPERHYREWLRIDGTRVFALGEVGIDTEGDVENPWCATFANEAGRGTLVRPADVPHVSLAGNHVILHAALHDLPVLRAMGIDLPDGSYTDTQVMAYLLWLESQGLKTLAARLCGMTMRDYSEVVGHWVEKGKRKKKLVWSIEGRTLDDVPREEAIQYACADADATLRVYHKLRPRITELGLDRLLDMEMGVVPFIDRMQTVGMKVDLDVISALKADLSEERGILRTELASIAGREVNTGSSKQVGKLLFEDLGIASSRKTKKGAPSTNDKILSALYFRHLAHEGEYSPRTRALKLVMEDREASKMVSSFCNPLPHHVGPDGRFHPVLLNTRVETGRLAGKGMNPLAFPKHSSSTDPRKQWGKRFRKAFIAPEGCLLGSWDLNQIELRVLAHISGDTTMLDAFRNGEDLHAKLVHSLYGIPPDKQTGKDRREGKVVNFAIPMGITAKGLLEQFHKNGLLHKTLDDAEDILWNTLHKVYPGVLAFQEESQAEARRQGHVRDMWDRIYYLPNIWHEKEGFRAGAERESAALKIQGGAQGIMKLAMAECHRLTKRLRAEQQHVEPLLQIHDDLLFEYWAQLDPLLDTLVTSAMCGATSLRVPITAKHESGGSWGAME